MAADEGCRNLCMGLRIHFPCFLATGVDPVQPREKGDSCFSPSQKEDFREYRQQALLPALQCAFQWLDSGECLSLSISGLAIVQLLEDESDGADILVQAMKHRGAEVLGQTYYHSVAGLFSEKDEFVYQVTRHAKLVEELAGRRPVIFENTEFVFNSDLAEIIRNLGFSALYSEGHDHILSGTNPNYVYSCRNLPVFIRNCRLSDDVAHRFHDRNWDQYPLTAEKFAGWIAKTPGDCIHISLDAGIFSGNGRDTSSFEEFFCGLPEALHSEAVRTVLPESILRYPSKRELQLEDLGFCLTDTVCALTGIQNMLQQSAFWCLEAGAALITEKEPWRRLQSTDHFARMASRSGSCGRPTASYTSREAYDYFTAYLRCLAFYEKACLPKQRSRLAATALRCLTPDKAFHFYSPERYTGYSAYSLKEFSRLLEFVPDEIFLFHQERGDFSRWIAEVLEDSALARDMEQCTRAGEAAELVMGRVRELCRRLK